MTRDDIIRMAYEASDGVLSYDAEGRWILSEQEVIQLAALVAAAEREKVAAWMRSKSYATGHGDTTEDLLKELEWQVAERVTWKCAEIAEAYEPTCDVCPKGVAAAIRARGEA